MYPEERKLLYLKVILFSNFNIKPTTKSDFNNHQFPGCILQFFSFLRETENLEEGPYKELLSTNYKFLSLRNSLSFFIWNSPKPIFNFLKNMVHCQLFKPCNKSL